MEKTRLGFLHQADEDVTAAALAAIYERLVVKMTELCLVHNGALKPRRRFIAEVARQPDAGPTVAMELTERDLRLLCFAIFTTWGDSP